MIEGLFTLTEWTTKEGDKADNGSMFPGMVILGVMAGLSEDQEQEIKRRVEQGDILTMTFTPEDMKVRLL